MENNLLIDILGWIGAISFLVAYALVSAKKWEGDSLPYQFVNLVGGACLIVNTIYYKAYPSSFLNLVWSCVAVYTILKHRRAV